MEISVIICTHNPRKDYLLRTLEGLKAQTLERQRWELLLIDNASRESLSDAWDLSWHPCARHVREEDLGLTPARLRGIRESMGGLLVYVDDDNVLASDFLTQALEVERRHPYLGVFGAGELKPEFEVPPAAELSPFLAQLALRTVPHTLWSNNVKDTTCFPWGAGLCVRREVVADYEKLVQRLNASKVLDRRGKELFCGGDDLFSWAAVRTGGGFGLFPELRILHLISKGRLTREYIVKLLHDHQYSHGVLKYLLQGAKPKQNGLSNLIHVMLDGLRNGLYSMRCEWAISRGAACADRFILENRLQPIEIKTTQANFS